MTAMKKIFWGYEEQYAIPGKRKQQVFKIPNGHLAFNDIIDSELKVLDIC